MEPPETVNGIIMGASGSNVLYTIQSISLQCIHTYIRKPYMLFRTKFPQFNSQLFVYEVPPNQCTNIAPKHFKFAKQAEHFLYFEYNVPNYT